MCLRRESSVLQRPASGVKSSQEVLVNQLCLTLRADSALVWTHFYFIRTTFFGATVSVLKFLSGFTVVKNSFVLSDFGVTVKLFLIFDLNFLGDQKFTCLHCHQLLAFWGQYYMEGMPMLQGRPFTFFGHSWPIMYFQHTIGLPSRPTTIIIVWNLDSATSTN